MRVPRAPTAILIASFATSLACLGWILTSRHTVRYIRYPYLEQLADRQARASVELRQSERRIAWIRSVLETQPKGDPSTSLAERVVAIESLAKAGFQAPWGISLPKGAPKEEVAKSVRMYRAIALDARNSARVRADAFYLLRWMPKWARSDEIVTGAIALLRSVSRGDQANDETASMQSRLIAALRRTKPRQDAVMTVFMDFAVTGTTAHIRDRATRGLAEFHKHPEARSVLEHLKMYDPSKGVRRRAQKALAGKGYR